MTNEQQSQFEQGRQAGIDAQGETNPPHSEWQKSGKGPSAYFEAGYWKGYTSGSGKWSVVAA